MSDSPSRKRKNKPQLGVRVREDLKQRFDDFCATNGLRPQFVIEKMLEEWLDAKGAPMPRGQLSSQPVHDRRTVEGGKR